MCDPVTLTVTAIAVSGTMSAIGQYQQGQSQNAMYQYQANLNMQQAATTKKYAEQQKKIIGEVTDANLTLAQIEAADKAARLARSTAELTGQQSATIGAMGIGGTTAEHIVNDTLEKAQLDQASIRYNANIKSWQLREQAKQDIYNIEEETKFKVWSLESEAAQLRVAGKNAKRAGTLNAATTLLSTAASAAFAGASLGSSTATTAKTTSTAGAPKWAFA